jgi:hypothetical protein
MSINKENKNNMVFGVIAAVAVVVIGLGIFYFSAEKKESPVASQLKAIVVFVEGSATAVKNGQKSEIHIGDILQSGDTINTDSGSQMDVSLSNNTVIRIRQNTSLMLQEIVKTIDGGERVKVDLTSGSTLNHINKLGSNDHYIVHTPTSVASVRGTSFEITSDNKQSVITVGQGKVHVEEIQNQKAEFILDANRRVTITGTADEITDASGSDNSQATEVADIIKNVEAMGSDSREMMKNLADVKSEADLEKVFQKDIELIELKDGRTLRGIIVSMENGKLLVQTVSGSHMVKEDDVLRVKYL